MNADKPLRTTADPGCRSEYRPEHRTGPIKGVVFDLDGTLYRMKWFLRPMLTFMLLPTCLRLPLYMKIRRKHMGEDRKSAAALLAVIATEMAEKTAKGDTTKILTWIRGRFYPAFERAMPLLRRSRPGLNRTLGTLRERGIRLAVLSDFSRVAQRLAGLGIDPSLFDVLASSEDAGCLKPCPRPLLALAKEWGLRGEEMLLVGDREDTDGTAAALAGMHFLRISDLRAVPDGAYGWQEVKQRLLALSGPYGVPAGKQAAPVERTTTNTGGTDGRHDR
jgi:FMN phosphatase YigB (HAD superfamily)